MKQSCTICCNCFCIGQGAKPDFVAGPGVPSFPESVGWVKGFSGLSSRSAALLTRTSAKKTRSEGLPLLSLGSFFYLRVTAAILVLRCTHAAALSVPGFDLQLAGLPGWSIFVTEDSLGDHWAVSDPDCCPQPHSWPWLATWHPISLVGHCSHQPPPVSCSPPSSPSLLQAGRPCSSLTVCHRTDVMYLSQLCLFGGFKIKYMDSIIIAFKVQHVA